MYNIKIFLFSLIFLCYTQISIAQDYLIVTGSVNTILDDGINQNDILEYQKIVSGNIRFKNENSVINLRCGNKYITINSSSGLHNVKKIIDICKGKELHPSFVKIGDMFVPKSNSGMSLSQDPGTSRNWHSNDNIINVGVVKIIDGHSFKLDMSRILDSLGLSGNECRVLITDLYKGDVILDVTTVDPYVIKTLPFEKNFRVDWKFEVMIVNSDKIIKGVIEERVLDKNQEILKKLNNEAVDISNKDLFSAQILFVQYLISEGLFATAHYYLDVFIQDSEYSEQLEGYRDYLLNQ